MKRKIHTKSNHTENLQIPTKYKKTGSKIKNN